MYSTFNKKLCYVFNKKLYPYPVSIKLHALFEKILLTLSDKIYYFFVLCVKFYVFTITFFYNDFKQMYSYFNKKLIQTKY